MRIIENHYNDKKQEYEITCPHCMSKLAYTFDDIVSDRFEGEYLHCGACDKEVYLDDEIPTVDTIQYPKDFFSYADGVPIKDDEISKWVKECVNDLDDGESYSLRASGDTVVFAYKSSEDASEATVIVAKKYQETDVKISSKNF